MAKTITFTYKEVDYTLEYTRSTIKKMETDKIDFADLEAHQLTAMVDIFKYAFWAHHKKAFKDEDLVVEILTLFTNKEQLVEALMEMIDDTLGYLQDVDEDSKNAIKWTIN